MVILKTHSRDFMAKIETVEIQTKQQRQRQRLTRADISLFFPRTPPSYARSPKDKTLGLLETDKKNEKALTEKQTPRAGCSKAEPTILPRRRPLPGEQDGQNLISWRWSLHLPTHPVWWGSMHAILSYRGNRPTNKQTHIARPADRTDN